MMAEFGQDGVEHDAAERIVLDAEDPQCPCRSLGHIGIAAGAGGLRGLGARQCHRQREGGAAAASWRNDDVATHRARELFYAGQSEPGAAEARGNADIGLGKRTEQPLDLGERQADAAVRHRKGNAYLIFCLALDGAPRRDGDGDAARFGEFDGVVDQVFQRRAQAHGVPDHQRRQLFRNVDLRAQALRRRPAGERIAGIARQRPKIEQILPDTHAAGRAFRGIDEQRREARQMFGAGLDGVDPAPLALAEIGRRKQIADGQNAGQRGAHLMRKGGQRCFDNAGSDRRGSALRRLGFGRGGV